MKRTITLSLAAALLAAATLVGPAAAARPDVACMQAGIKTLQSARLLDDVARGGIAIETAVLLGVTVRPGADISGVPNPILILPGFMAIAGLGVRRGRLPGATLDG